MTVKAVDPHCDSLRDGYMIICDLCKDKHDYCIHRVCLYDNNALQKRKKKSFAFLKRCDMFKAQKGSLQTGISKSLGPISNDNQQKHSN